MLVLIKKKILPIGVIFLHLHLSTSVSLYLISEMILKFLENSISKRLNSLLPQFKFVEIFSVLL